MYRLIFMAAGGKTEKPLHHRCGNPWCVNPWHLEPMEQNAHVREHGFGGDWGQAAKTECPQGHPYDEENTYVWTNPRTGGKERHCRICTRQRQREYRARKRKRESGKDKKEQQ